jgi:hypothetical protein
MNGNPALVSCCHPSFSLFLLPLPPILHSLNVVEGRSERRSLNATTLHVLASRALRDLDPAGFTNPDSVGIIKLRDLGCRFPFGIILNLALIYSMYLKRHQKYELKSVYFNFIENALSMTTQHHMILTMFSMFSMLRPYCGRKRTITVLSIKGLFGIGNVHTATK